MDRTENIKNSIKDLLIEKTNLQSRIKALTAVHDALLLKQEVLIDTHLLTRNRDITKESVYKPSPVTHEEREKNYKQSIRNLSATVHDAPCHPKNQTSIFISHLFSVCDLGEYPRKEDVMFYNNLYVYPIGYKAMRLYKAHKMAINRDSCIYICEIKYKTGVRCLVIRTYEDGVLCEGIDIWYDFCKMFDIPPNFKCAEDFFGLHCADVKIAIQEKGRNREYNNINECLLEDTSSA